MPLSVTMTGSGTIGSVEPGWSITEQATPVEIGNTTGAVGSATVVAGATSTSRYALDNPVVLTSAAGAFRGRVTELSESGPTCNLTVNSRQDFLVAEKTMPPVWFDNSASYSFLQHGVSTGQAGLTFAIAVDPADGAVYVSSFSTYSGTDRTRIIKYSASGTYITEFGSVGTAGGQFAGTVGLYLAVSPVDGSVYVADSGQYYIHKFTNAGVYVTRWGSVGSGNGQFGSTEAMPVTVDTSGNVYVGDRGNSRIQKFTNTGTYSAQVAMPTNYQVQALGFGNSTLYASLDRSSANSYAINPRVRTYNTSLVQQNDWTLEDPASAYPYLYTRTVFGLAVNSDGTFWVTHYLSPYVTKYTSAGVLDRKFTSTVVGVFFARIAVSASGTVYVLSVDPGLGQLATPYAGNLVQSYNYSTVTLSQAIQRYMVECHPTLNGYSFSYTAASDPVVAIPDWTGNVWSKLKEMCAAYGVEIAVSSSTIIVRDIGTLTLSIPNRTPVTATPQNASGGRQINIVAQRPTAGGGIVWDAAVEGKTISVAVGESYTFDVTSRHSPYSIETPSGAGGAYTPPGYYTIVDSLGVLVDPIAWAAAGGAVTAALQSDSRTITISITGPQAAITGYTGPFEFRSPNAKAPAFSIAGNGVFLSPTTVELLTSADAANTSEEVAQTIDSPFIDTVDRAYQRGVWAASRAAGPNTSISFSIALAATGGLGLTVGALVSFQGSKYRITDITWGELTAAVTASRYVTMSDYDSLWSGQTLAVRDAFWSGYSLGDRSIQPLLTTR